MMYTHKFTNWVGHRMPNTISLLRNASNLILLICVLLIWGCATAKVDHTVGLRIIDLETNVEKMIPNDGYREVIVDHYAQSGFLTLTRKSSNLLLRYRDEEGRVIEETELPLLTTLYFCRDWINVSPDRSKIVYFDFKSHNLIIRSLITGIEWQLLSDIASSSIAIKLLRWLNDREILVLINDIDKIDRYKIIKINIENGQQSSLFQPFGIVPNNIDLTFDRYLLALVEEIPIWNSKILIIDVSEMKIIKAVPKVMNHMSVSSVCWLQNGQDLAFSVSSEGIYLYNIETDSVELLQGWVLGGGFIDGKVNNMLVVSEREGKAGSRHQSYLLNPANKQRRSLGYVNGRTIEIPGTKKIVMMVGY